MEAGVDLIVNQVMQLQIVHVSDGYRAVEELAGAAVAQSDLSVSAQRHSLPELSVLQMAAQILHHLRLQGIFIFLLEILPGSVYIVVGHVQGVHDVILVGAVEHGGGDIEAQRSRREAQVQLQHLPDIHTGRHAQRIQHDIQGTSVGQEGHILHGKHAGHNTLVSVTSCHLVAHGDLSLLGNIDADRLIDSGGQLVAVLPGEHLGVHHDAVGAVGHLQGGVLSPLWPSRRRWPEAAAPQP